jgi:hypothetical protein
MTIEPQYESARERGEHVTQTEQGELDLATLIASMSPTLDPTCWCFAVVTQAEYKSLADMAVGSFKEAEGMTLIVPWEDAAMLANKSEPMARITLEVHSSLAAVGLTAAVSTALAEAQMSANVVAGYFHDHIFVPFHLRQTALACLERLSSGQ